MRSIFCAATGTVLEVMLKKASHYCGYLLGGINRCAEIWMVCTCPNQLAGRCSGFACSILMRCWRFRNNYDLIVYWQCVRTLLAMICS